MSEMKSIAASVNELAAPGMKPKDLLAAVRKKHPDASKKQVIRAAFYAVIEQADIDPERARLLQSYALDGRAGDADEPEPAKPRKKARPPARASRPKDDNAE